MKTPDNDPRNPVGTGRRPAGRPAFAGIHRVPPLLMIVYLVMAASTMLFAVLVVLYAATRLRSGVPTGGFGLPRYFSLSTIVLLMSSYTLGQAPGLYRADNLPALVRCLGATLLLGCIFSGLQLLGWRELHQQGVLFEALASGSFIYVITGLHVLHLVVGLGVLLAQLVRVRFAERDAVRTLVFIRDPYHLRNLRVLATYWHFVDALWVVLFVVFLFLY